MVIAVNARFLIQDKLEGYGQFTYALLHGLCQQYPEHQFHLIVDRQTQGFSFPANAQLHVLSPAARHPVLWKYWFDWKLPRLLKRIGADVFFSPDGFCSLGTKVPQCMVVHDLGFLHYPEYYRRLHVLYYKVYTPRFITKAKQVVAISGFTRRDLLHHYHISEKKIAVIHNGIRTGFQPLGFAEKQLVKDRFTSGNEYFIHVGAIHPRKNLINLLKAFSIFKKRLQSSMKLVLVGRMAWKHEAFRELLDTYKYRADVITTGYLADAEVHQLTAAAYALVYPSVFEGFGMPVLESMAAGVPVLTSADSAMSEIGGPAALYFDPFDPADMGEKLMMIYKDEQLRSQLVEKGKEQAAGYSWSKAAEQYMQVLQKTAAGE